MCEYGGIFIEYGVCRYGIATLCCGEPALEDVSVSCCGRKLCQLSVLVGSCGFGIGLAFTGVKGHLVNQHDFVPCTCCCYFRVVSGRIDLIFHQRSQCDFRISFKSRCIQHIYGCRQVDGLALRSQRLIEGFLSDALQTLVQYHLVDSCLDVFLCSLECVLTDNLYISRNFQFLHLVVPECVVVNFFYGAGNFQCFYVVSRKSTRADGFNSFRNFYILNLLIGEHAVWNGCHALGQLHLFDMCGCLLRIGECTASYGCNAVRNAYLCERRVLECGISDGLQGLREFHCLHAVLHFRSFRIHYGRKRKVSDAFQFCRKLYGIRGIYGAVGGRISEGAYTIGSITDCGYILTGFGLIREYQVGIVLNLNLSAFRKTGDGGSVKGKVCGAPWLFRPRFGRNGIADERLLICVVVHVRAFGLWNIKVHDSVLHSGIVSKRHIGNLFGLVRQPYGFDFIRKKCNVVDCQREIRGFREIQRIDGTSCKCGISNQLNSGWECHLLQIRIF